jgi:hypothetical protein
MSFPVEVIEAAPQAERDSNTHGLPLERARADHSDQRIDDSRIELGASVRA